MTGRIQSLLMFGTLIIILLLLLCHLCTVQPTGQNDCWSYCVVLCPVKHAVHSPFSAHPLYVHRWGSWVKRKNGRCCMRETVLQPQTHWRFPISSPLLNTGQPFPENLTSSKSHQMKDKDLHKSAQSSSVAVFSRYSLFINVFEPFMTVNID